MILGWMNNQGMSMARRFGTIVLTIALCAAGHAQERPDASLERARQVIESYVSLERAYDPRLADLYADEAIIKVNQTGPNGESQWVTAQGWQYKKMVRDSLPKSRAKGYRAAYSGARYEMYGKKVRVSVMQYVEKSGTSNPVQWVIGPGRTSQWLILEEVAVRR
jgi:hypothetical protein